MADLNRPERPKASHTLRLVGIIAVIVVGWLVLLPALSLTKSLIPLVLYVVIAVVSYQVGKVVGRHGDDLH
jgi:hypothetical protein